MQNKSGAKWPGRQPNGKPDRGGGWIGILWYVSSVKHAIRAVKKQDSGCHGDHSSENQTGDPQTRKQVAESDKTGTQTGPAILYVN